MLNSKVISAFSNLYFQQMNLLLQGVPTSLEYPQKVCERNKIRLPKKCILLQKIEFQSFFVNCKNENGFWSNFSPISNNLLSKLLYKTIGESRLIFHFQFCSWQKKSRTQFFGAEYIFSNFFDSLTNFRKSHFAYSKLAWTPCRCSDVPKQSRIWTSQFR